MLITAAPPVSPAPSRRVPAPSVTTTPASVRHPSAAADRSARIEWPRDSVPALNAELIAAGRTQLAFAGKPGVLDSGADFWDMLAVTLEAERRRG
ncbi:hypothetical protein DFR52_104496 [Hoeflea marina]|uniref:Uncharacterized protein n=1 Tax=Hoeflea marina TaxID=274592 RepID=A0A317PMA6_9HYPH|nr:hypothetical protein [Hoeflea marina]PWV99203.1 hypothetical protein DFR52_104496 [Hoeflea marina]